MVLMAASPGDMEGQLPCSHRAGWYLGALPFAGDKQVVGSVKGRANPLVLQAHEAVTENGEPCRTQVVAEAERGEITARRLVQ